VLGDFFSYSIARYDDVSWGTKAVSATGRSHAVGGLAEKAAARANGRRQAQAQRVAAGSGSGRGEGGSGINRRAALSSTLRNAAAREASAGYTNMLSVAQLLLCLALAITNSALEYNFERYLLYLGLGLSIIGYMIMGASMLFFVSRAVCGASSSCSHRANALLITAGWLVIVGALAVLATAGDGRTAELAAGVFFGTYAVLMALSLRFFLCGGGGRRGREGGGE
jgi:hypothetical protein